MKEQRRNIPQAERRGQYEGRYIVGMQVMCTERPHTGQSTPIPMRKVEVLEEWRRKGFIEEAEFHGCAAQATNAAADNRFC